jgi:fumarate reductase subunit C
MNTPYLRTMRGWWRRDAFFVRYMGREATALAVAAYALVLLTGLWRLAQGEEPFNAWLLAMQSAPAIVLHLVLLAAMVYHAVSWFEIMPKTMPILFVRGRRVQARTITRVGFGAVVLASIAMLALAWMPKP